MDWENQHPTQAEIDSLLQNCVGGCLPSPAACSFPLCHHINTENLQDAMERRLPAHPPVCSWPPILWTDGLRQEQLQDSSSDFANVPILSSPASGENKCQSRQSLLESELLHISANGSSELWHQHWPLLIEAEFPFLAIEEEKKGLRCLPPGLKLVDCTSHSKDKVGGIEDGGEDRPTDTSTLPHH